MKWSYCIKRDKRWGRQRLSINVTLTKPCYSHRMTWRWLIMVRQNSIFIFYFWWTIYLSYDMKNVKRPHKPVEKMWSQNKEPNSSRQVFFFFYRILKLGSRPPYIIKTNVTNRFTFSWRTNDLKQWSDTVHNSSSSFCIQAEHCLWGRPSFLLSKHELIPITPRS